MSSLSELPIEIEFGDFMGFLPDYQFRLGDSYFEFDNSEEDFFLGQLEKNGLETFKNPNEQLEIVIERLECLYSLVTT